YVPRADHVKQYPAGVLHSDGGKLFCTSCKVTVDHYRESAVYRHLDSSIHRKRKAEIQSSTATALLAKKQKTVTCIKLRKFFSLSVANGGAIPSSAQLRHEYLPKSCQVSQAGDYGIGKTVWLLVSGY
ncbi:CGBP1 protein, partial [Polyodon spathula]|nr:CGBP1 protein [Polyodon spathula]